MTEKIGIKIQSDQASRDADRLSVFELNGRLFGLDILLSREVIVLPRFTPIPNTDEIFHGVFNLRGEIYPAVDVSPILGLAPKKICPEDMVIVVEGREGLVLGMLVDKIHSVTAYFPGKLKAARGLVSRDMEPYLKGILQEKDHFIHILDLGNILRAKKFLAHY